MTEADVLDKVISILRDVNAVEPSSSDEEIAEIKLPDLPFFEMQHEDRKELLHQYIVTGLADLYGGTKPNTSPDDGSVFDLRITVAQLAHEIWYEN